MRVAPGRLAEAIREGVVYTLDVPVPKGGAYQIRAAVRDESSKKVGSASQFIEIPDLKHARIALASIVLQDGAGSPQKPAFLNITPARRQFHPGGELEYLCSVQSGRRAMSPADVETAIRILRDGKEVYSAPAKLVQVPAAGPAVFGILRLTGVMAPGEYYLQVIATDRRGGKNALADQWTDFTVLP